MSKVRLLLVGCGGISNLHAKNLVTLKESVEVVGCVDVVRERAQDFANRFGCLAFSDPLEAAEKLRPEAALIAVPPDAHGFEERFLEHGIHLFVEKPVAGDLDTAKRILAKIERAGVINSVGYMWRYLDVVQKAKKEIGDPERIGMIYGQYVWAASFPPGHWWLKKSSSGGQIVEQVTHTFDLIRYFAGEASSIYARLERRLSSDPSVDIEDSSVVMIRFKSGVPAAVTATWRSTNTMQETFVRIFAKELVADIVGHQRKAILYRNNQLEDLRSTNDPYLEELRVFLNAVKTGDSSGILSTYRDGYKTLELTIMANQSHERGAVIHCE
jgi:myo-inositol 2-dehydrogenase/D-chiro-inositol 1-dehydrogenase